MLGASGTGKTQLAAELLAALGTGFMEAGASPALPGLLISDNPALALVLQPRRFALALLMGLDLPLHNETAAEREAADQRLRQALADGGMPYQVVYGLGPARLHNALSALQNLLPHGNANTAPEKRGAAWVWACDTCSDPDCERRLLSDLLAGRAR